MVYTALHGSYGLIWVLKDLITEEKSWVYRIGLPAATTLSLVLASYWLPFWVLVSGNAHLKAEEITDDRLFVAIMVFNIGLFLMIGTDVQKSTALKYYAELRKYDEKTWSKRIIDDGFMSRCRNLNYVGEMMIYGSYVIIPGDTRLYILIIVLWSIALGLGVNKKELSARTKPGWHSYAEKTLLMAPRFIPGRIEDPTLRKWAHAKINYAIWVAVFGMIWVVYQNGGLMHLIKNLYK